MTQMKTKINLLILATLLLTSTLCSAQINKIDTTPNKHLNATLSQSQGNKEEILSQILGNKEVDFPFLQGNDANLELSSGTKMLTTLDIGLHWVTSGEVGEKRLHLVKNTYKLDYLEKNTYKLTSPGKKWLLIDALLRIKSLDTIKSATYCTIPPRSRFEWYKKGISAWTRILWTEIAVVGYGSVDYFGYNVMKNSAIDLYRVFQGIMLSTINYFLATELGVSSAVSFDIQAITAVPDLVYYMWDAGFKGFGGFSGGNEFSSTTFFNHLNFSPGYYVAGGLNMFRGIDVGVQGGLGLSYGITVNL